MSSMSTSGVINKEIVSTVISLAGPRNENMRMDPGKLDFYVKKVIIAGNEGVYVLVLRVACMC